MEVITKNRDNYFTLKLIPSSLLTYFPSYLKTPDKTELILITESDLYEIIHRIKLINDNKFYIDGEKVSKKELINKIKDLYYNNIDGFKDFYFSFIENLNNNIIEEIIDYIKNISTINIDEILNDKVLKDFQKVAIIYFIYKFIKYSRKSILIGDVRGLGKTLTSIKLIDYLNFYPSLVICPAYLRINWDNEIKKWIGNDCFVIRGFNDLKLNSKKKFVIVSYELFSNEKTLKEIQNKNFKSVILDECQYIKNPSAKRTKNITNLLKNIDYIIQLSGTPLWNKPQDGYKIFNICDDFVFRYKTHYESRYCKFENKKIKGRTFKMITGTKNEKDLGEKIRRLFMIRRTKEQVLPQLEKKIRTKIYCNIDETIKLMSNEIIQFIEKMSFKKGINYLELKEKILEFQQNIAMVKIPIVVNMIKDIIYDNESVVVFFYHRIVGETLHKTLLDEKIDNILFIGGLTDKKRKNLLDKFNNTCNVFLGSIRACGMGLNLTKANNVIFLQYETSPNWNLQAEDRCHRIGQEKTVNIYYISMKDTIDEIMIDTLIKKSEYIDSVMMDKESKIDFEKEDIIHDIVSQIKN